MKPVSPISAILWAALATTIPAALVQRQGEECQFYQTFSTQFSEQDTSPPDAAQLKAAQSSAALKFQDFSAVDLSATNATLAPPPPLEKPYVIAAQLLNGVAGTAQFLPADSSVKYFSLDSIYYACAVAQGATAQSCKIKATATNVDGEVVTEEFPYSPKKLLFGNEFTQKVFDKNKFSKLKSVTWTVTAAVRGRPIPGVSMLFDSVFVHACVG